MQALTCIIVARQRWSVWHCQQVWGLTPVMRNCLFIWLQKWGTAIWCHIHSLMTSFRSLMERTAFVVLTLKNCQVITSVFCLGMIIRSWLLLCSYIFHSVFPCPFQCSFKQFICLLVVGMQVWRRMGAAATSSIVHPWHTLLGHESAGKSMLMAEKKFVGIRQAKLGLSYRYHFHLSRDWCRKCDFHYNKGISTTVNFKPHWGMVCPISSSLDCCCLKTESICTCISTEAISGI